MDTNIKPEEGTAVPTPPTDMSQGSALTADQPIQAEAKPEAVQFAERTLGREFASVEEAEKTIKNLNSLVGDQTVSSQRKALEKIASQANMSTNELIEYLATQDISTPQETVDTPVESSPVRNLPDDTTKRLVRLETDTFVKDNPEAQVVRDQVFAKALATGKPVNEIWATEFAPLIELGKKSGAKKLQQNLEGQPTRATSTASEDSDTKVDFSGINAATGKRWTAEEMEHYVGYAKPSSRL
jgi:hypothetical protein